MPEHDTGCKTDKRSGDQNAIGNIFLPQSQLFCRLTQDRMKGYEAWNPSFFYQKMKELVLSNKWRKLWDTSWRKLNVDAFLVSLLLRAPLVHCIHQFSIKITCMLCVPLFHFHLNPFLFTFCYKASLVQCIHQFSIKISYICFLFLFFSTFTFTPSSVFYFYFHLNPPVYGALHPSMLHQDTMLCVPLVSVFQLYFHPS